MTAQVSRPGRPNAWRPSSSVEYETLLIVSDVQHGPRTIEFEGLHQAILRLVRVIERRLRVDHHILRSSLPERQVLFYSSQIHRPSSSRWQCHGSSAHCRLPSCRLLIFCYFDSFSFCCLNLISSCFGGSKILQMRRRKMGAPLR